MNTKIHFINAADSVLICTERVSCVPRVGDEIRLSKGVMYKVVHVVWVYDEPESNWERVNIGVIGIN